MKDVETVERSWWTPTSDKAREDMESAHWAKEECEILNHRLYVLGVEIDWGKNEQEDYIPSVIESYLKLSSIMEEWIARREDG